MLMAAMILPAAIHTPAAADAAPTATAMTAQGGRSPRTADRQQTRPATPAATPTPTPTTSPSDGTPAATAPSLSVPSPLGGGPDSPLASVSPLHPATTGPATRAGSPATVVFDPAGGTAGFPTRQTLTTGQHCPRPTPDPTRAGYVFDGWFNEDTPLAYDFNQPVTTDRLTLKAHWTKGNDTWNMTPDHGTTQGGDTITLTPPAPRGIRFTQVSTGYSHSLAIGSDGNLYTWGDNQYGELGRATNTGTTNPNPVPGRADPPATGPAVPTGVVFGGAAGTVPAGNTDGTWRVTTPAHAAGRTDTVITWTRNNAPQADTHLPYTYEAPSHTVNFDPDGGTPTPPDQQVAEGHRASRPADPVKTGHVFDGWFITGTPVAYDFNRPVTGRVDLKAHWSPTPSWTISPGHGSERGGEQVTLTPPAPRGIRFTQTSTGDGYSMAIGSDGNIYTW